MSSVQRPTRTMRVKLKNMVFYLKKNKIPLILEKYFDFMNQREEISGDMYRNLHNRLQLLSNRVSRTPIDMNLLLDNVGPIREREKLSFLERLVRDLNKLLCYDKFSDLFRGSEIYFLCRTSQIPHPTYKTWIIGN